MLILLNSILIPTYISYHIDVITGRRKITKTSIADGSSSLCGLVATHNNLYTQNNSLIDSCYKTTQNCSLLFVSQDKIM